MPLALEVQRSAIPQTAMGSLLMVLAAPGGYGHLRIQKRQKDLLIAELLTEPAVETPPYLFCHGLPFSMEAVLVPCSLSHIHSVCSTTSRPLSLWRYERAMFPKQLRKYALDLARILAFTWIARHSRVSASTTIKMRNLTRVSGLKEHLRLKYNGVTALHLL